MSLSGHSLAKGLMTACVLIQVTGFAAAREHPPPSIRSTLFLLRDRHDLPTQIEVEYYWAAFGWRTDKYTLKHVLGTYEVLGTIKEDGIGSNTVTKSVSGTLPESDIQSIFNILKEAEWQSIPHLPGCCYDYIPQLDGRIAWILTFQYAGEKIKLFRPSRPPSSTAWYLKLDKKLFVTSNQALGPLLRELFLKSGKLYSALKEQPESKSPF